MNILWPNLIRRTPANTVPSASPEGNAREASPPRRPHYTVQELPEAFAVRVLVPGVSRANAEVSVHDDILTLQARRTPVASAWRLLRQEAPAGDFSLQLRLNVDVEQENIGARVDDGVLTITLPKAVALRPRPITVE